MADAMRDKKGTGSNERAYIMLALRIVGEFGAIIAAPVVLLAILGKWLDARYGTAPMFLIAGFVVAFALSAYAITKKARAFAGEYETIGRTDGGEHSDTIKEHGTDKT